LFEEDIKTGLIDHPMDIRDAWKNSYSENTSQKVWAAKFTARHPNLVALELSSFKCGHDAPIYTVVEEIVTKSGTPYFSFKDIDENKPTGSIKIRVETIGYFLKRYRENTSQKVWAAKFTARHPNLVALELSSFKCGHDAPIYTVVEEIVTKSGTPYFSFKDIDENKPTGSIKIRVETIGYFLKRYR